MASVSSAPQSISVGLFRCFATGLLALALAVAFWFLLMIFDLASMALQESVFRSLAEDQSAYKEGAHRVFSLLSGELATACGYSAAFFLGALFAARVRWSLRPGLSAFIASGLFLGWWLTTLNFGRGSTGGMVSLFIPMITAPLGGWLGGVLRRRRCPQASISESEAP